MPVYMIRCGEAGPVKIGKADDPQSRLRDLQTGHHEELAIIRVLDGGEAEEKHLHTHFAEFRIRGEWFQFSDEMLTVSVAEMVAGEEAKATTALQRAIDAAGGQSQLASKLRDKGVNVKQQHIWAWLNRAGKPPAQHVPAIEAITGVSRMELRPDVFAA